MKTTSFIQQFRQLVYCVLPKRADAIMDLIDALTVAGYVSSPVALSEEAPFRRKFSSVYDVLGEGKINTAELHTVLHAQQSAEWERIAGYEIYAVDTTPDERPEAETVEGLVLLKSQKNAPVRVGQKYSWLVRLVKQGTSWVAPWDVRRVAADSNDNQTAVAQVEDLDRQEGRPKVVVGDSLYANQFFLGVFLTVSQEHLWVSALTSEPQSVRAAQTQTGWQPRCSPQTWPSFQDGQAFPSARSNGAFPTWQTRSALECLA